MAAAQPYLDQAVAASQPYVVQGVEFTKPYVTQGVDLAMKGWVSRPLTTTRGPRMILPHAAPA